jgi:phosphatidylglycerol lysyltransferase
MALGLGGLAHGWYRSHADVRDAILRQSGREPRRADRPSHALPFRSRASKRRNERRRQRRVPAFARWTRRRNRELQQISAEWLAAKSTGEKHFSVGAFSRDCVARFPIALVWHGARIVAFANLWPSGKRDELSIDLMRFGRDAPRGTMDFLIIELMLWGRARGFRWFNLGMAPLSGLGAHPLAPAWHRLGNFVFRHGEHFYNFEGLRSYKEKFAPVWEPKYLVSPGGLALARVLLDVSLLIAGGMRKLVTR